MVVPFSSIIMQSSIQSIPSGHREFISDTAFDYYGKRLVSASANGHLRVWNEVDGEFKLQTEIEAYSSLISRVDWAHPVFGQLFAACFHNDTVVIYQECIDCNKHKEWKERCQIPTSNTSPLDIAFSPSFFGLNLAVCYKDGSVSIYSPTDPFQLRDWQCDSWFHTNKEIHCLSWCKSRDKPMSLVIGTDTDAEIWRLGSSNKWELLHYLPDHGGTVRNVAWSNSLGKNYETIATACSDGCIRIFKVTNVGCSLITTLRDHERDVWRIEWNTTGTVLASSGDDNKVRLWKERFDGSWTCVKEIGSESVYFVCYKKLFQFRWILLQKR